jgi:hypothetical protein
MFSANANNSNANVRNKLLFPIRFRFCVVVPLALTVIFFATQKLRVDDKVKDFVRRTARSG